MESPMSMVRPRTEDAPERDVDSALEEIEAGVDAVLDKVGDVLEDP
jgi:hypothetical protein